MTSDSTLHQLMDAMVRKAIKNMHFNATLGKGDISKTLYVTNRPGFVWARVQMPTGMSIQQIRGRKAALGYGAPVFVKYGIDDVLEVAEEDATAAISYWGHGAGNTGPHGMAHGYFGSDPILLSGLQFLPLLCQPNNPPDLTVRVRACILYLNGQAIAFRGGTLDLTSSVPSGANEQRIVIVGVNITTLALTATNGSVKTVASTSVTNIPFSDADAAAIDVDDDVVPVVAVRLYKDQTQINIHDIFKDMRPYFHLPWGGGSGSGAESGEAYAGVCQARLTTVSGTPKPTGANSPSSTLYLTEYVGQVIGLFNTDTNKWEPHLLSSEISVSLSGTASLYGYDVFVRDNSGTLELSIVSWGSGTSRATALGTQNGVLVKESDHSYLWLGSIMIDSGGGTCTQDEQHMGVDNHYNKEDYKLLVQSGSTFWSYGSATKRAFDNNANNRLYVMNNGYKKRKISLEGRCYAYASGSAGVGAIGIGKDSTTTNNAESHGNYLTTNGGMLLTELEDNPSAGVHFYQLLEWTNGNTIFFTGTAGVAAVIRQTFKATAWG